MEADEPEAGTPVAAAPEGDESIFGSSTTALGLLSAIPLIGNLLAPRRYSRMREWLNKAFLPEPRTELTFMRNTVQSQDAVAGLMMGFAAAEKYRLQTRDC